MARVFKKKTLEAWREESVKNIEARLDRIIQNLPVYGAGANAPEKTAYTEQCNSNITAAIVAMLILAGFLLWFAHYTVIGWAAFIAALVFPVSMLFWYYQKRARANYYFDLKNSHDNKRAAYQKMRDGLSKRASETVDRINSNNVRTLSPFQDSPSTATDQAADIDSLVIGKSLLFLGVISAVGIFSMCYFCSGSLFYIIVNSALVGYLIIADRIKSCLRWSISTGLLLIPLVDSLLYIGPIEAFFLEVAAVIGVWHMNNNA